MCVGIKYSRDGGNSWTLSTGGYPISNINWYALASSSTGQFVVAGNYNGQLWTSIDYGATFAMGTSYSANQRFFEGGLAMSSDGTKVIAGVNGLGILLYTFNTGSGAVTQIGSTYIAAGIYGVSSDSSFTRLTFGTNNNGKLKSFCNASPQK